MTCFGQKIPRIPGWLGGWHANNAEVNFANHPGIRGIFLAGDARDGFVRGDIRRNQRRLPLGPFFCDDGALPSGPVI